MLLVNCIQSSGRSGILARLALITCAAALVFCAPLDSANPGPEQASDVTRATLDNGLRVVVVRDTLAPVVTTVMNYQVGSNEAPSGYPGMAHAQEHMMFRGSPGLSADQLADISAAMGGNFNADTQQTATQYFFTVPAEDLDVALHLEAVRMRGSLDTDDLWTEERPAIEQEVAADLSNPQYVFYTQLLGAMFQGTPYAHDALGTRLTFDKTTGQMLHQFYASWYVPNNAIFVIAGDVQPEHVLAEVKRLFGDIPQKPLPARSPINLVPVQGKALALPTDLPYGLAVVSFRMPGSNSPDYAATQLLGDVLSSQRGSLYAMVPEGKALYAGFQLSTLPEASLGYALAVYPKGGSGDDMVNEIKKILADDAKNGLPSDLIEASRRHEIVDAEFQRNSVSGLAMAWSEALAIEGRQSPDDDIQAIAKASPADVSRVARQYLTFNDAITAVLTPQASGKPTSSSSFGGQESLASKQTHDVALPAWAAKALSRLSVPESSVRPVVTTLPNGLKLIVQPESVSNTVTVSGQIKNNPNVEAPKGKEGVGNLLNELFEYGTTTLDRLAFQKALDDIGAEEAAGTGFSVAVLPAKFDQGVQLLAENELSPALPESAFKTVQRRLAASVAGQLESPEFLTHQALNSALFPKDDPSLRHATPDTVASLTLQDVRDYYHQGFRPDLATIVVIGNITPDEAKAVITKYFDGWKAVGAKPETDMPTAPGNKASTTAVPNASRVQDEVTLAETLGLNRFSPDYYALELGNHVLGGGFYATRYYRDLREKGGLVYTVSSSFNVGRTRGIYEVRYGCDPPNVSKAHGIVARDLKDMQTAPPTGHELEEAKALLLREIPLSESSVDTIAGGMLSRTTLGLPLDEPIQAARHYVALTPEDVRAAFAKWIRPDDLVQITQGPAPQ
ncbi:MAG: pitrilysin family protein [Terriglobia bacterium]|jgi:zinc protease